MEDDADADVIGGGWYVRGAEFDDVDAYGCYESKEKFVVNQAEWTVRLSIASLTSWEVTSARRF